MKAAAELWGADATDVPYPIKVVFDRGQTAEYQGLLSVSEARALRGQLSALILYVEATNAG